MDELIKKDEFCPSSIKIVRTDKKFPGDCKVETVCKHCGTGTALSAVVMATNIITWGRNDNNCPSYRYGRLYILKYIEICVRNNRIYLEPEIRWQILKELADGEDEKM